MLKVSVNGKTPEAVDSVVLYDEEIPIAVVMNHGNVVYWCDSVRDREELIRALQTLGISYNQLHPVAGLIKGNL